MWVPVMDVGIMGVNVDDRHVNVRVAVLYAAVASVLVGMLMVFIMRVGVRVFLLLVCVQMPMVFSEVQPNAGSHQ